MFKLCLSYSLIENGQYQKSAKRNNLHIERSQETEKKCQAHKPTYSEYNHAFFQKTISTSSRVEVLLNFPCVPSTVGVNQTFGESYSFKNGEYIVYNIPQSQA